MRKPSSSSRSSSRSTPRWMGEICFSTNSLAARPPAPRQRTASWPAIHPRILELDPRASEYAPPSQQPPSSPSGSPNSQRAGRRRPGPGPPPLAIEEDLKAGRLPCPRGDEQPQLRDRHGRRRPGDPGRVAEPRSRAGSSGWAGPATRSARRRGASSSLPPAATSWSARGVVERMHARAIRDGTTLPRARRLAQHSSRWPCSTAGPSTSSSDPPPGGAVRDADPEALEGVLGTLAGAYPSDEFAELKPCLTRYRATGESLAGATHGSWPSPRAT